MLFEHPSESWTSIPGCAGYFASAAGRILGRRGLVLKPHKHKKTGYLTVSICLDGDISTRRVHKLVAEAFYGPCPAGLETNHKDGDKTNCRPDNLEYITHSANKKHAFEIGVTVSSRGEGTHVHKLTEEDVREARRLVGTLSQREIARRFGVCQQVISKAISGQTWRHVV